MSQRSDTDRCELCGRQLSLTFHHLIPRKLHRRSRFKKTYSRDQLNTGIWVCQTCHSGIHRLHDEMTLGRDLNTREKLLADPAVQRHVVWVGKQRRRRG